MKMVLIFDVSGSMHGNKIKNTIAASKKFMNLLPLGAEVGLVKFESKASIMVNITSIDNDAIRQEFIKAIDKMVASGGTCIGCGLNKAMQMLGTNLNNPNVTMRGYVALFTDGGDTDGAVYDKSRLTLYNTSIETSTIAISDSADKRLTEIGEKTGGSNYFLRDAATESEIINIMKELIKGKDLTFITKEDLKYNTGSELYLVAGVNPSHIQNLTRETEIVLTGFFMKNFIVVNFKIPFITARILSDSTKEDGPTLILRDDGNGADSGENDGIYSCYVAPKLIGSVGSYTFELNATLDEPWVAMSNKVEVDVIDVDPRGLIPPPAKISTLKASMNLTELTVTYSWIAVGNELDIGTASKYDLFVSLEFEKLISNHKEARLLDQYPDPEPSGTPMSLTLNSLQIGYINQTFYCGVVAVSSNGTRSPISNIVSALLVEATIPDEYKNITTMAPTTKKITSTEETTRTKSTMVPSTELTSSTTPTKPPIGPDPNAWTDKEQILMGTTIGLAVLLLIVVAILIYKMTRTKYVKAVPIL